MNVEGRVKEVIVDSRINKILALRTDSVSMLESLEAIASFYHENTVNARRSLRHDLELQNIEISQQFINEFGRIKAKLNVVEDLASNLEDFSQSTAKKIRDADENMKLFMEKAAQYESKRNYYLEQSKEISQFLSKFQLSPAEVDVLYGAALDNFESANTFFQALQRLRKSYLECKAMVERHCYSSGFELLDVLGQHQDYAYQRLFEWVKQKNDALIDSSSAEDIDVLLQMAVKYLRRLPAYYSQCQDLIIQSRRSQLVQKFIQALTLGGPSGQLFRAIDLHSHDSTRYVGDMLAWMHQTIASEEEFLHSLFGEVNEEEEREKQEQTMSTKFDDENRDREENESDKADFKSKMEGFSLDDMLARSIQGLGRPLRVRIMQTLESRPTLDVLFVLLDILTFYETTFASLIKMENAVHSTTKGCLLECRRMFQTALNRQSSALIASPSSCPLDLSLSVASKDCLRQLRDIFKSSSTSLSSFPFDSQDPCRLEIILGGILEPLLQSCRLSGQSLPQAEMSIFMMNNIAALKNELLEGQKLKLLDKDTSINHWLSLLEVEITTWMNILVGEECNRTLRRSDMDKLLELAMLLPEGIRAAEQPGLTPDRCTAILRAFYASLLTSVVSQFDRLLDLTMREETRCKTSQKIAESYETVYDMIANPSNGYPDLSAIVGHSKEEVRVLLGCT